MQKLIEWLSFVRPFLESLYFLSAIALAVCAVRGLRQIRLTLEQLKLTREIAKTNAKRESFKLAAEQCRYFADYVLTKSKELHEVCEAQKVTIFPAKPFKVENGEIKDHCFPAIQVLSAEITKVASYLIAFLNSLEAFAIFFASGIAEDAVGYVETAPAFCGLVEKYVPAIHFTRSIKAAKYDSTLKLYESWKARLRSNDLVQARNRIESELNCLKTDAIKPIDID